MTFLRQTIDRAAPGESFAARAKTFFVLLVSALLLLPVPWLVAVIAISVLWHFSMRWAYETAPARWLALTMNEAARRLGALMLKDARNSPFLFSLVGIGIFTPSLFLLSWWWQSRQERFSWLAALAYHVLIYGPYFAFFAPIVVIIHKEGHEAKGMFRRPFAFLSKFFGYFMAIFYGHVPENYPMGHVRIHHKYNNSPDDATSTVFYDRARGKSFLLFLPEFSLFWTGISIARHHCKKGRTSECLKMTGGMIAYYLLIAAVMCLDFWFGFAYLLLPHLTTLIFLGAVTYTWHAWTDPNEPDNIYKNTITILDGHQNVFNEDYHAEHHERLQAHWSEYPENYRRHLKEYAENRAIVFRDTQTLEVFFWLLFGAYDKMADHMVDLNGDMSKDAKISLLKERLQPLR